jgi:ubiquinone/menaquinone biosynthesis C-methylase UbiE
MNIHENHTVLDFGCGSGSTTILIKKIYPASDVFGIDIDRRILSIARKKAKKLNQPISFELYKGAGLPYEDGFFDRAVSSLVFHHLSKSQKESALKEIHRVLKPDGELHIGDIGIPRGMYAKFITAISEYMEPISDNRKGLIPHYITKAGFKDVQAHDNFNTMFGTVSLYSGRK